MAFEGPIGASGPHCPYQIYFDRDTEPEWRAMTSVKDINFSNNNISISYIPERYHSYITSAFSQKLGFFVKTK